MHLLLCGLWRREEERRGEKRRGEKRRDRAFLDVFVEHIKCGRINENTTVLLSCGEPALYPFLSEILLYQKSIAGFHFFTNCSVWSDEIAQNLGKGLIITSLDSGTAETFKKVKGVDAFEKTYINILKYRQYGDVVVKYIVLPDINDNQADLVGFINFIKKANITSTILSFDGLKRNDYPYKTLKFTAKMYCELVKNGIHVVFYYKSISVNEQKAIDRAIERFMTH